MTDREDKKCLDNKIYSLSQTASEKLYLHQTTLSVKKCVCNKNDMMGDTSHIHIKSQNVSNISEKSASHTSISSVYTEVESQVDSKSKFADNLDVYTSEFDHDSIRYSSDQQTKQFESNISSVGKLIDDFSKIREEISCLSRTTEKDISSISSNCVLDTENSHSENHCSLETQLPIADENICIHPSLTIISDQKALIVSEKCSNADEIVDLKTSTLKNDYMELNENLSEKRENKTKEYGTYTATSETPIITSPVPISLVSSSECDINVNKERDTSEQQLVINSSLKSINSNLEHIESVSEAIMSAQQSFKSVSIPTANEDGVKIISIENNLIESLEKSMCLAETVNAAKYETPQIVLHAVMLGGTVETDMLKHSEIEKLNNFLRINDKSSEENDSDIAPNGTITMNVSLLKPVEDTLKTTYKNCSEKYINGYLSIVEETLSTGVLKKDHGTEEQVNCESCTKLSELIPFQNERVPSPDLKSSSLKNTKIRVTPEEAVEILTTKNHESETQITDIEILEEDKSSRIRDIYGPTCDVLSPSSPPELDFSENRLDRKPTPDNILGDEAKQLMIKQLAIEKEIQQIEQQQKEQLPYVFMREIPNKPPPPYTPPSQYQKKKPPSVLPEEQDIQEVTRYAANVLHKVYLSRNLLSIRLKECNFKLFSKRSISKPCCEVLLDLCTQLAVNHYRQFMEPDELSWLKIYQKLQLTAIKPYDMKTLENYLREKLKEYFGFTETQMEESTIIKWSRKKRDHVDEILISESQHEELEWISYDKDEFLTKDCVVNDIMNILLSETAGVLSKLVSKKTFAH